MPLPSAVVEALKAVGDVKGQRFIGVSGFIKAWHTMESATRVDPDNAIVWFFRADFLRRSPGRNAEAIAACKKALELDPSFTPAENLLAELSR